MCIDKDFDFSIIFLSRKGSTRVPNKMLRPFGSSCLFEIVLNKLEKLKSVSYAAVYEQEFVDMCKAHGFRYIKRNHESANGEVFKVVWNFIEKINTEWIFAINPCNPFLEYETIQQALELVKLHKKSLCSTKLSPFAIWDSEKHIINKDIGVCNSKYRKPCYISADAFVVFKKECLVKNGFAWDLSPGNPELFVINDLEAMDINTELDFKIAEFLWKEYSE